ncbi:transposase [Streptomyces sp. NBC_00059]|uniref:transposase n=1 Tax=Streptomyces sp. NBC_00059 TaxID=2975635 RepID=UPI002259B3FA|nr:transposase [Streptomyces sp. NBC_00059]MCX5416060.1 transposase [Streptomyces sp. NBC_00059]
MRPGSENDSGVRRRSGDLFSILLAHRARNTILPNRPGGRDRSDDSAVPDGVRRKTGRKHHLICDGRGSPLMVITTAANVNDVTQTPALVDGIPPVAGRRGRPRRRPDALLGDKGYDSNPNRDALRKRRILPVISLKGCPNIKGMGKLRYVVEQTFALLHHFKRLAVRWERRTELHDAFGSLACSLICWRRLRPVHDRHTNSQGILTPPPGSDLMK